MRRDWRGIFNALHVPWRDRGKNTSRNHTNVNCPYCRDDEGFHLAVSEDQDAYYCRRRPQHAGRNVTAFLIKLGAARTQAITLLNAYRRETRDVEAPAKIELQLSVIEAKWQSFEPASQSQRCLDYLYEERGFDDPATVCDRYDLRYAAEGRWAMRLLLPIKDGDQLLSWTGRALRSTLEPKYYVLPGSLDSLIYAPRPSRNHMVAVEGPLDALKGAAATEQLDVSFIGLLGKNLNNDRLFRIRHASSTAQNFSLSLDNSDDVVISDVYRSVNELAGVLAKCYVSRLRIPSPHKDVADMSFAEIRDWVNSN